ncbi:MAG TPA: beta-ketoacyl-ACP synthase III [Thermodesulfobacteriota bacterium]|nr:beta-ketoacyl-ACP synthase III [Thermodesulfobacteriota bacterium]
MIRSRITGTGSYAPEKVITNHDLEAMVDTTDDWISMRTGIKERHVSDKETSTDMAVKASQAALKSAGVKAKHIDLIVVGTVTPDMTFPSTACYVQAGLGVRGGAAAFDVSAACSGFLYALDIADKYMKAGASKKALVIGVDQFSRIIDWQDRSTCVLFGDGAGAVVLEAAEDSESGILSSHIHSDGRQWELLYAPGAIQPSPFETRPAVAPYLKMQGNETFKIAVRTMESAVAETLKRNGLKVDDVALVIPHQANQRIIKATRERLKLPDEKVFMNLEKYGNTSAASIPLALDEAARAGRIKKGDLVVFVAFGGGLTWASAAVRW